MAPLVFTGLGIPWLIVYLVEGGSSPLALSFSLGMLLAGALYHQQYLAELRGEAELSLRANALLTAALVVVFAIVMTVPLGEGQPVPFRRYSPFG